MALYPEEVHLQTCVMITCKTIYCNYLYTKIFILAIFFFFFFFFFFFLFCLFVVVFLNQIFPLSPIVKLNANYAELCRVGNLEADFQYVPLVHFFF